MFPSVLFTDRLELRWPVVADAEEVFERYARDIAVARYLSWRPHQCVEETRAFSERSIAEREAGTSFGWLIRSRKSAVLLGSIGIRRSGHIAQLGYCLARDSWGLGFATEATRTVVPAILSLDGIERVQAYCDVENKASARVLEKADLKLEGTLRRFMVMPNLGETPRDMLCYAKVRD